MDTLKHRSDTKYERVKEKTLNEVYSKKIIRDYIGIMVLKSTRETQYRELTKLQNSTLK